MAPTRGQQEIGPRTDRFGALDRVAVDGRDGEARTADESGAAPPLMEKFESYDITDDPDPEFGAKVAELQRRHYKTDPQLVRLVADLPSHTDSSALPDIG
ncbi:MULTISPECIES: hypothetical protein [unclassified Streptomyces]|uniref:hypothetical protein n=1 Tax=unclassified Streptomyces TaxID=2593676 RepID=UPI003662DD7B